MIEIALRYAVVQFLITCMISDQIALHSVQLPLLMFCGYHGLICYWLCNRQIEHTLQSGGLVGWSIIWQMMKEDEKDSRDIHLEHLLK